MTVSAYGALGRDDLAGFDGQAKRLVLEMVDAGWIGRVSRRHHAILRAPDGQTTASVARDSKRARSGRNADATFRRWQRRTRR